MFDKITKFMDLYGFFIGSISFFIIYITGNSIDSTIFTEQYYLIVGIVLLAMGLFRNRKK